MVENVSPLQLPSPPASPGRRGSLSSALGSESVLRFTSTAIWGDKDAPSTGSKYTNETEASKGGSSSVASMLRGATEGGLQHRAIESTRKIFFYRLEQIMSEKGRLVQIPLLFLLGAVQVFMFGGMWSVVWTFEEADPRPFARVSRYIEGFWAAWTYMSDGGTHAKVFAPEQRLLGGIITVAGIIYLATVLAFIVDMVREKMDAMRVGTGQVHEGGHTVILHWTDRTIPLILELCIANESEGGGTIVVLAKESTETMQAELSMQLPKFLRRGTKIIVRFGNPAVVGDLTKVSADRAKAVIILAAGVNADESDSGTLRCVLSLKSMGYKMQGHIVAEVRDVDNEQLLQLVGGKLIETIVSHDVLGRLMLMSVRQLGLASIYDAMLGFEGAEFYVKEWPELVGTSFGELAECFPNAVPVGIVSAYGSVMINPPLDQCLGEFDQVIVIAEDDDTYWPMPPVEVEAGDLPEAETPPIETERILICGWRRDIRDILKVLDCVVSKGSEVHMMTHCLPVDARNDLLKEEGLDVEDLKNISIKHFHGNTSVRRRLEGVPLESYSACLIFADQAYEEDAMQADSHSLATLVLIRDVQTMRQDIVTCPITCEVLDARTHRMVAQQRQLGLLSDFVQSNKFVARILAMIGEARSIKGILDELLGATGNSLLIVQSGWLVHDGESVSFATVAKRATLRNAVLIGYQEMGASKKSFLNPERKHEAYLQWDKYDLAIIGGNRPVEGYSDFGLNQVDEETAEQSGDAMTTSKSKDSTSSQARKKRQDSPPKKASRTDAAPLLDAVSNQESEDLARMRQVMQTVAPEGGNGAETAAHEAMRLSAKFWSLMSDSEQLRFGAALERLGERVKSGAFSAKGNQSLRLGPKAANNRAVSPRVWTPSCRQPSK